MIQRFSRWSISSQVACLSLLTLLGSVSALLFWAGDNAIRSEVQHARTVADMADSFRTLSARHGGFYVRRDSAEDIQKVGRYLSEYVSEKTADGQQFVFHQKNPFLAIGDYSSVVQASRAEAKFRITSDNYMNPDNRPDAFDVAALRTLREQGLSEQWAVVDGQLRYARSLRADAACLSCHGQPTAAPRIVQAKYPSSPTGGGGYGYEVGQVVGVTSISVPHKTPWQMVREQSAGFWVSVSVVLALMLLSFGMIVQGVVRPLKALSNYAVAMANAGNLAALEQIKGPHFDANEGDSRNEIHQEAFALHGLHDALQAAMAHIRQLRGR